MKITALYFILLLVLLFPACGKARPEADIIPNDIGEKADAILPKLAQVSRDESFGNLAIITGISDEKNEAGYYNSDLADYLNGEQGIVNYLYGSGKEVISASPEGILYDSKENKIVLDGFQGKDTILLAEKMGSDLTLELRGDSYLNSIQIIDGGLQIEGDGKLTVESTTRESGLYINSPKEYACLIIKGNVSLDISSTNSWLIAVASKQAEKNFYYMDPLKMSDGKKRTKIPEMQTGALWYVENTGDKYYAPQSFPEDPLIVLYKMDHVIISNRN